MVIWQRRGKGIKGFEDIRSWVWLIQDERGGHEENHINTDAEKESQIVEKESQIVGL